MKALVAEELLSAWEQGLNQPLLQRVLILLVAAYPETEVDNLMRLSIGQRDLRLLQLREHLFGQPLLNSAVCPECGERIEWNSRIANFLIQPDPDKTIADEFDLVAGEYALRFRLPNSLDIAAISNGGPVETETEQLLLRCLLKAEHAGVSCDLDQLPESVIQQLNQQLETLDPQANIRINLSCPECTHSWDVLFDIGSFLWTEVNGWAEQMLQTVYKLAAGYGWSEREILNLSPVRRQLYAGMLG